MSWFTNFLTSSIGKKLIMSLTGLFLITFLIVHLAGNLQLLKGDNGKAFNLYAEFMTSNPLIKAISYGLYAMILLHAFLGISLWLKNKKAKGTKPSMGYKSEKVSWTSKNMAILGILVLAFLFIHMGDFWFKMKFGEVEMVTYDGTDVKNLYEKVKTSFGNWWVIIAYIIGLLALGAHLWHGFESAFQTLGINHSKYTPLIKNIGKGLAVILTIGNLFIPIYVYVKLFVAS
jgi:succinate dehydrogenase / fumarate reductase cytochrome b subunit